ncbi:hypothetical protein J3459_009883 [Metarhizium acridum]|nr:hypothetical protein J3459_009883 [Metarhizium acridum]
MPSLVQVVFTAPSKVYLLSTAHLPSSRALPHHAWLFRSSNPSSHTRPLSNRWQVTTNRFQSPGSAQGRFPRYCSATNRSHGIAAEACAAWDSIPTVLTARITRLTTRVWPATIKATATWNGIATVLALSATRRAKRVWPAAEESGAARVTIAAVLSLPDATLL